MNWDVNFWENLVSSISHHHKYPKIVTSQRQCHMFQLHVTDFFIDSCLKLAFINQDNQAIINMP